MKALLSIGETARRLGLSVDTVRELERAGELHCERTEGGHRRFRPAVVDAYLRHQQRHSPARRVPAPPPAARSAPISYEDDEPELDDWVPPPRPVAPSPPPPPVAAKPDNSHVEALRTFARSLIPWNASPSARSAVLELAATYVNEARFPSHTFPFQAYQDIRAKVDAVLEPLERQAKAAAEKEERERRVRSLIEHGKWKAQIGTMTWDWEDSTQARAEIERELKREVRDDWSEREVNGLVEEMLGEWEEETED